MPSAEQLKHFLVTAVLPVISGVVATWVTVHLHFLALFHVTHDLVASAVVQLGVFGISAALAWLASHHILKLTYHR
jgi:hypothetical protein